MADTKQEKGITLQSYLKSNKDLLSTLAVFVGITVFAASLSLKLIAIFISFLAFTCATIILIELCKPLKEKASITLNIFRYVLFLLAFAFFAYWFVIFDVIYPDLAFFASLLIIFEVLVLIFKRFIYKSKKTGKIIIIIIIILTSLLLARLVANKLDVPIFKAVVKVIEISSQIKGSIQ